MQISNCSTCRFWAPPESGKDYDLGRCRRFPPTWRTSPLDMKLVVWVSAFPETHDDVSCGCWQRRGDNRPKKNSSAKREAIES